MNDYMTALHQRFFREPDFSELEKEIEQTVREILRMGAYQILFLDRVPDSAAVDEAVKLTRAMGMEAACGFINAVLRNLSRGKDEIAWPDREADPVA